MMKKTTVALALAAAVMVMSAPAVAGKSSIGIGYAHTGFNLKTPIGNISAKMNGFNTNYGYEADNGIGGIVQYNYTQGSLSVVNIKYFDLVAGPSYSFNNYIKVYATIGLAYGNMELYSREASKAGFAYGVGMQFYPIENIGLNIAYSHADLSEAGVSVTPNTFTVGLEYRF